MSRINDGLERFKASWNNIITSCPLRSESENAQPALYTWYVTSLLFKLQCIARFFFQENTVPKDYRVSEPEMADPEG